MFQLPSFFFYALPLLIHYLESFFQCFLEIQEKMIGIPSKSRPLHPIALSCSHNPISPNII